MINNRWFVIDKLDGVRIFVERALSVYDDYVRIVNGEYEFPDSSEHESSIANLEEDTLEPEDILFGEYERASDVLLNYQEIVIRAALNEINSIVEYEIKLIASYTVSKQSDIPLKESWQRTRGKAVKVIENSYKIKISDLPGYTDVETVRKIINAYKHDNGYSENEYEHFYDDGETFAEVQKRYELDVEDILKCVNSVKQFIKALPNLELRLGEDMGKRLNIVKKRKR